MLKYTWHIQSDFKVFNTFSIFNNIWDYGNISCLINECDTNISIYENFPKFIANGINDSLKVHFGGERRLDAVDHSKFRFALGKLFLQGADC